MANYNAGAIWLAVWAGIFSAAAVIVSAHNIVTSGVGGVTGWLEVIATALAWIAAGVIYNYGRMSRRDYERNTSPANKPPATTGIRQ